MGIISAAGENKFISADYIYSKIKREFKSFASVNLLDDVDFPSYTMEILRKLGNGAMREEDALITINGGRAILPKDYYNLNSAYRCSATNSCATNIKNFQNRIILEDDITCEVFKRDKDCQIECECNEKLINRITIRKYVNDQLTNYEYGNFGLLHLSPNAGNSNVNSRGNEITINNNYIFTNFKDDAIYIQYYAYPFDEDGLPMVKDNIEIEKAVEWYIKYQLLLNFWLVDDLANVVNKWQKAEQEYKEALAEARHNNKIPAFSTMINFLRNVRGINKFAAFSKNERY